MVSALEFNEKLDQNSSQIYAADGGGTDAYAITLTPTLGAYANGQVFNFMANTANTGAATLNVDGLGAIAILKHNDVVLEDNDIEAGQIVTVIYDGTSFQMQSQVATGVAATKAQIITGTATNVFITPGRQQFHESTCKAWVRFTGATPPVIVDSYNVSGVVRNGTGDFTISFTTNFANANYVVTSCSHTSGVASGVNIDTANPPTVSALRVISFNTTDAANVDANEINIACFGTQ